MAKHIKHAVIQKIQQAKYYSIIVACRSTRVVCRTELITVTGHVDAKQGDSEEHLVGFIPEKKTTSEDLTELRTFVNHQLGLDIKTAADKDTIMALTCKEKEVV